MIKINGNHIGEDCYPNNERIFRLPLERFYQDEDFIIELKYTTDIDLSILNMCKRYLENNFYNSKVTLVMKYIPYSRMDRNINGYMFSLKYFCKFINELYFDEVIVLDPHSNVATALLDRCVEIDLNPYIDKIMRRLQIDYVLFPDNGSLKKYTEILTLRKLYFYGNKKRNLQTGKILYYELIDCPDLKGKNILIIDDLCSKGGTCHHASLKLKELGVNEIYLYFSHCEDSIYDGALLNSGLISKIFTTDSILSNWTNSLLSNIEQI